MFGIGWKHRIARKVMIELLYAEGIRWAGWYRDRNLIAKYETIFGAYMRGGFGPKRQINKPATSFIDWSELDRWLAES